MIIIKQVKNLYKALLFQSFKESFSSSQEKVKDKKIDVKTRPEIDALKEDVKKNEYSKEELKTLSNKDLLKLSKLERIKYITKNNVNYKDILEKNISEIEFFFDLDWNWKDDTNLYRMTTIWQVLWEEIWEIKFWEKIYKRDSLDWEFFCWNKRLIIHTWTKIEISKIRNKDEIENFKNAINLKINNFTNYKDQDIVLEALKRWVEVDFVYDLFSKICKDLNFDERKIKIEELFTELDRKRSRWSFDANSEALKKFIKDDDNDWNLDSDKLSWSDLDFSNVWDWVDWLLNFISIAEWTNWNYNAIYWDWKQDHIKFTDMTLREVLSYQKQYTDNWSYSSAIWKYQFIRTTLNEMIKKYDISLDETFSPEFQDNLAILMLKEIGLDEFISTWDISKMQYKLSQKWASIPQDESWLSFYHNDWVNKSRVKSSDVKKQLETIIW